MKARQKLAYNVIKDNFDKHKNINLNTDKSDTKTINSNIKFLKKNQLLLQVQGYGGTGKS